MPHYDGWFFTVDEHMALIIQSVRPLRVLSFLWSIPRLLDTSKSTILHQEICQVTTTSLHEAI